MPIYLFLLGTIYNHFPLTLSKDYGVLEIRCICCVPISHATVIVIIVIIRSTVGISRESVEQTPNGVVGYRIHVARFQLAGAVREGIGVLGSRRALLVSRVIPFVRVWTNLFPMWNQVN